MIKSANKLFFIIVIFNILASVGIGVLMYFVAIPDVLLLAFGQFVLVVPTLLYFATIRVNPFKMIPRAKLNIRAILLLICFAFAIMPLMTFLNSISMLFVENSVNEMFNEMLNNPLALNVFLIAFLPAVVEELVFRGIIYHSYRQRSIIAGIFLNGFIFGLIHMNFNQFSYAIVMGFVFSLLIEATGSIFAPILVHFIINGSSVVFSHLLAMIPPDLVAESEKVVEAAEVFSMQDPETWIMLGVLFVVAAIASFIAWGLYICLTKVCGREFVMHKPYWKKAEQAPVTEMDGSYIEVPDKRIIDGYLIAGSIICLLLMIATAFLTS